MFKPYQNGTESHAIHDLTLENGEERINLYGNLQMKECIFGLNYLEE